LFIYKRKEGDKVLIGNDHVVAVTKVQDNSGNRVHDAVVSLGFGLPQGTRLQRGDKFLEDYDDAFEMPFPVFYRQTSTRTGRVLGYALSLPLEQTPGTMMEPINGFNEMDENDHPVSIYFFRSEAEVRAFELGLAYPDMGVMAWVSERRDTLWAVLVDRYEYHEYPEVNPTIRNITAIDPLVLEALKPERKRA